MGNKIDKMVIALRVDAAVLHKLRERAGAGNFPSVAAYLRALIAREIGSEK